MVSCLLKSLVVVPGTCIIGGFGSIGHIVIVHCLDLADHVDDFIEIIPPYSTSMRGSSGRSWPLRQFGTLLITVSLFVVYFISIGESGVLARFVGIVTSSDLDMRGIVHVRRGTND